MIYYSLTFLAVCQSSIFNTGKKPHIWLSPFRYGNNSRSYAVRVGDYHTLVPEEFEQEIGVQQIVIHRNYRPDSSDYDIALVRLQGPGEQCARLSTHVLPACLPLWRERPQKTASNCHITGWGDTGNYKSKEKNRRKLDSFRSIHLRMFNYKTFHQWFSIGGSPKTIGKHVFIL